MPCSKVCDGCLFWLRAADVHMLLGDLAMETERFDSAQHDFAQALSLLSAHLEVLLLFAPYLAVSLRLDLPLRLAVFPQDYFAYLG